MTIDKNGNIVSTLRILGMIREHKAKGGKLIFGISEDLPTGYMHKVFGGQFVLLRPATREEYMQEYPKASPPNDPYFFEVEEVVGDQRGKDAVKN